MTNQRMFSQGFGELLKTYRRRQRLTQKHLAQQLGVHMNTVSSWELGTYLPATRGLVLELARHLALSESETRQLLEASLTALPPSWRVPLPRNPFFTGREEVLEALHTHLHAKHSVALTQSCILHGLGGIGKTQIALEYAYRHTLEYSAVFWIGAETEEQVASSFMHTAWALGLPGREDNDQQRMIAAVKAWLSTHERWLLIWDNVDELGLLDRFLPSPQKGAILLTTRRQVLGTRARSLPLHPMEQEEGLLLLLRRAKLLHPEAGSQQVRQFAALHPASCQAATDLVEALGGLPLALDQAGAYVEATQCGVSEYLKLFEYERAPLLAYRGEGAREHPESVATTFQLAVAKATSQHPALRDLLRVCALLHADAIPEELFRQGGAHLGAELSTATGSDLVWNQLMAAACGYSLLARQGEQRTLSLHRLVQVVLLEGMTEAERKHWTQRTIEALDAGFPTASSATKYPAWKLRERLLPHVLFCLRRDEASEESLVLASLANKVAPCLQECGRYAEAEPLFLRALRIREHILGERHPEVATALHNVATFYYHQGRYVEAEPLYLRAWDIIEQARGRDHPQVATVLNNLCVLYKEQGKYAQAEPLCLRALQIREQVLGPDHPHVASTLNNQALLSLEQGKYAQAESLFLRALRIREQAQGVDHPQVAFTLRYLAALYAAQGNVPEAESLYQRALQIWEQSLGPDHPNAAWALSGLATLYRNQGKDAGAEALYQRALSLREHDQSQHADLAYILHDFAILRQKQGRLGEALSLAERALQIRSQAFGETHPGTVATRALCAQLVEEQGTLQHDRPPLPEMSVVVRGATGQPAYTRSVRMREVTFTCTVCRQTVTQLHYPSGTLKYCSEGCAVISRAQRHEERVARQREKRRVVRKAQVRSRQCKDV